MATESTALTSEPTSAGTTEPPPATERARRSDRRIPTARETLATLPEPQGEAFDFEPHDTIPAPPWMDELESEPAATQKTP
jgi:hypothetical protein